MCGGGNTDKKQGGNVKRLLLIGAFANLVVGFSAERVSAQSRGAMPVLAWECPASHPIKGNFTAYSGERCIFHAPVDDFIKRRNQKDATKPLRKRLLMVAGNH
jgi:hypothetical protein